MFTKEIKKYQLLISKRFQECNGERNYLKDRIKEETKKKEKN